MRLMKDSTGRAGSALARSYQPSIRGKVAGADDFVAQRIQADKGAGGVNVSEDELRRYAARIFVNAQPENL